MATGRELDQLARFAACLGATLDVDTLIQDALEPLSSMAGAEKVLIAIARQDARLLIPQTAGWNGDPSARGIPAPAIASLGTEAVAFSGIDELPASVSSRLTATDGFVAVVPLWAQAHLRGVILLLRRTAPFTPHMLKMLTTAGRQFALAVENSQLLADLQDSYRKLMDTQEDLIRAERLAALGQLSATMAHEIRNPLATIFSAISQIRRHGTESEMSSTLLNIAEEEASRLNHMVGELLKFARPRRPVMHPENINQTVSRALASMSAAGTIPDGIRVTVTSDRDDITVLHDVDQIEQALTLLVDNSIEAIEAGEGEIDICVSSHSPGAVISVADTGCGFPDELAVKIFEPFFSTRPTGTGLGLPTVKRIAEDHRGTLEIACAPGTRTTARLFLQTKQKSING